MGFLLRKTIELSFLGGADGDMRFFVSRHLIASDRRSCKLMLTVLWVFGFVCGSFCAAGADNLVSLMRACCDAGVSIVGLFFIPFFPFLISAAAVYCSAPLIMYLTGLTKAFLIGFCFFAVYSGFTGGGWLVCLLLMFTDLLTAPALFRFQYRAMCGSARSVCWDGILTLLWFAVVTVVDRLWIVPLLKEII